VLHVIMATYNRRETTVLCLKKLIAAADAARQEMRVVLFDDGSVDGTAEAVLALLPNAQVLRGDGSAFWARSMSEAEIVALRDAADEDYLMWLNDDVALDPDAIERALELTKTFPTHILVAASRDPSSGEVSYGGFNKIGWHPLKFEFVPSSTEPREVDTFNGNIVFVRVSVAKRLGGIDGRFSHALADIDYGLRAVKSGEKNVLLPGTFGTCARNVIPEFGSLPSEWKAFLSQKGGGNLGSLRRFHRTHAPHRGLIAILYTYIGWWARALRAKTVAQPDKRTRSKRNEVILLYPFADDARDATAAMVRGLDRMLLDRGFQVTTRTMARGNPAGKSRAARGVARFRRESRNRWYLLSAAMYAARNHRRIVAVVSVDVPVGVRDVGRVAKKLSRGKVQLVSWVMDLYWSPKKLSRAMPAKELRRETKRSARSMRGLAKADSIVSIGECMKKVVLEVTGRTSTVIPLWKAPSSTESNLRHRLGLSSDDFVLLYAGTAGDVHPLGGLAIAIERLSSQQNLVLVIAGRGSEVERLQANTLPGSGIVFVDRVDDSELPALLASADMHVAALDEAATGTCVPSKAYTAFAAAKPCLFLGSPDCQVALDIKDSGSGAIAPTDDPDEIARQLTPYLRDSSLARRQGAAALRFLTMNRSPEDAARRWAALLSSAD
jgi:glycosyltransferase involved in cell wall biosynthesis